MGCTQGTPQTVDTQKVEVVKRKSFYEEYNLGKKLGSGAFAQVRIATAKDGDETDAAFAVKIIDLRNDKDKDLKQRQEDNVNQRVRMDAKCEAAVWRKVSEAGNNFCIKLHEVFWDTTCCYMVMERCDMTLLYELEHTKDLNEAYLAHVFEQTVMAVEGLHSIRVVHRDIKPDNFLVNAGCKLKLGDFGLSAVMQSGSALTEVYGTAPFMSPEMLKDGRYDEKTDIWSVGVFMYVLIYGQFPYYALEKSSKAMKAAIREGKMTPSFRPWKTMSDAVKPTSGLERLIRRMIERDPSQRPSAAEAAADSYWQKVEIAEASGASLRPMLQGAIRAGAFSVPRRNKEEVKDQTDLLLSELSRRSGALGATGARRNSLSSRESRQSSAKSSAVLAWNAQSQSKTPSASATSSDMRSPFRKKDLGDSSQTASTGTGGNSDHHLAMGTSNTLGSNAAKTTVRVHR
mmetsp:Transcript_11867/g.27644  ORF Transcript_11867/g.27644 Transcript_11867/m.27644 type:complete len:458 (+) Transcript_11867:50-1423(+)